MNHTAEPWHIDSDDRSIVRGGPLQTPCIEGRSGIHNAIEHQQQREANAARAHACVAALTGVVDPETTVKFWRSLEQVIFGLNLPSSAHKLPDVGSLLEKMKSGQPSSSSALAAPEQAGEASSSAPATPGDSA